MKKEEKMENLKTKETHNPLMGFSSLNFKGDLNIQWYEDGIAVEAKDAKEPEAKMLVNIIIKQNIPCQKINTKTGVFLKIKEPKKILALFLEAQKQALAKDQFLFITYEDKSKEVFTKDKAMTVEEVKQVLKINDKKIEDTKKLSVEHTHGCGEDISKSIQIGKKLDEV